MKTSITKKIIFGTGLIVLAISGGWALQGSKAQSQTAETTPPAATANEATTTAPPDDSPGITVPVIPVTPATLPANILPTSPLAQVIRLVQAGVSEDIIMTYVTNSGSMFNLDSDSIVYLTDIGVPDDLVAAMMQHDQQLQQQLAANQTSPPAQQPATPEAAPAVGPETQPDQQPVTVNYFYDTLSPYGNWVDVPGYGRCWRPTVVLYNSDWQPYCDHGHWVYTDCGWCWISDYAWGATFHYGRWFRDPRIGWCWWPDTTWAPSWVTWRYSTDYCGWAPLPPFTTCRSGGFYYRGTAVGVDFNFGLGVNLFTFVPTRNFCDPHPRHFRVDHAQAARFYDHTRIINNIDVNNHTVFNHGISPVSIANVTHTPVRRIPVRELAGPAAYRNRNNHDANRPAFPGNSNTPRQTGSPVQNQNPAQFQHQQSTYSPNRPSSPRNNVITTHPQRPTPGPDQRSTAPNVRVQTPPARFNPQPATPRGQQPIIIGQPAQIPQPSRRMNTPRNSTRNFGTRQNAQIPTQPRYVAPPVHYSAPPPLQPAPRSFNPRRNEPRMDAPRQVFSPPPAALVERQQNYQPRQNYSAPAPRNDPPARQSAPAPSQRSSQQDQNQHGPKH
jgi:hypothetical protein